MIKLLKSKITQVEYKLFNRWVVFTPTKREVISIDDTHSKQFWREIGKMTEHLDKLFEEETEQESKIKRLGA